MPNPFTIETLWKEFSFQPNDAQREAVLHTDGPLYLPAGPGSGKTRVLLWRTVNLIAIHNVHPEAIFLATFTEKAARQLREGIRALLGAVTNYTDRAYDVERMYVGTVHSLCQRILADRRFYPNYLKKRPPTLVDDLKQYFLLYRKSRWDMLTQGMDFGAEPVKRINAVFGTRTGSRHDCVKNCTALFNRLSEECLRPEDWTGKDLSCDDADAFRLLLSLYEKYCADLVSHPAQTDFALLQQAALEVVKNYHGPALFEHVIVDEYQDTNTVQERLYFGLAGKTKNICVVGDDEQALYRFRGATVENFVQFPARCQAILQQAPTEIALDTNYRSRRAIVEHYKSFMNWADWSKNGSKCGRAQGPYAGDYYRVGTKKIEANSKDDGPSVVATSPGKGEAVAEELAVFCKRMIDQKAVANPNQIAFLFPSLKSTHVGRIKQELEKQELKVYAPRASTFLEVEEAVAMFGVFLHVFGKPNPGFNAPEGSDYQKFYAWIDNAYATAQSLMCDLQLRAFVKDKQADIKRVLKDYAILQGVAKANRWDEDTPYDPAKMKRALAQAPGLSEEAQQPLKSYFFDQIVQRRIRDGDPFKLGYILSRATSLDWTPLDLFYRLCGFDHFKEMFDLAENGEDEGPICNLGLISQYLARFSEEYMNLLTARILKDDGFKRLFFSSYLYVLYRRGESEYEDAEDPFPRGRIPFLTIHQAKGLQFPVVVLGNTCQRDNGPQAVETLVGPLLTRDGEPLHRMSEFDNMRKFYVALSRAENLLVLPYYKGAGLSLFAPFKALLPDIPLLANLDISTIPPAKMDDDDTPRNYSFTADYLVYDRCPRQYMVFRKYGFVPSRSQTMVFGSLVHRTIDDLHQFLIAQRTTAQQAAG